MGCDIHQYAERRIDGHWVAEEKQSFSHEKEDGYDHFDMNQSGDHGRNYWLFGVLSYGYVRKDWAPGIVFPLKGEPEDASQEVASLIKQWDGDGHSHNHLTFAELKHKAASLLLLPGNDPKQALGELAPWIASFSEAPGVADEDRRVVFWFDN